MSEARSARERAFVIRHLESLIRDASNQGLDVQAVCAEAINFCVGALMLTERWTPDQVVALAAACCKAYPRSG